jgi:hypothetical protein
MGFHRIQGDEFAFLVSLETHGIDDPVSKLIVSMSIRDMRSRTRGL